MSNAVLIENLNFSYGDKKIFENFNLEIKKGEFVSLIGKNGSGKSTLVKILSGLLDFGGCIKINDIELTKENIYEIRKSIGVVLTNINNQIISEKVLDNIAFSLENLCLERNEILERVKQISSELGIENLLDKNISSLTSMQKDLVTLASILVYNPSIIILDETFNNLDSVEREKILTILKKYNKKNNLTIINITQNSNDYLFGDSIIFLDNGQLLMHDKNEEIFKNYKIFNKSGLQLPFMVDLSIKLKYYNLLDKIIYNMEEMVDTLWK